MWHSVSTQYASAITPKGGERHRAMRQATGKHSIGLQGKAPKWNNSCPQGVYNPVGEIRWGFVYTPTVDKTWHGPLGKVGLLHVRKKYPDFLFAWRSRRADVDLSSLQCPWGLAQCATYSRYSINIWFDKSNHIHGNFSSFLVLSILNLQAQIKWFFYIFMGPIHWMFN